MPVRTGCINGMFEDSLQSLVNSLNLTICLRVIRILMFFSKSKHSGQFRHHAILKMAAMVSENHLGYTKSCYNLIEHEESFCFPVGFISGYYLCPFRKIVHNNNDIFVPPSRCWVARHVINPPLHEGAH